MLRTSTKNVAYEVISCLIDNTGKGVLTEIIKWLTTSQQNILNNNESVLDHIQRKKYVPVESEEEPESFIKFPSASTNDNASQHSAGSGSSGPIRIKIRKNSIDPHSKIKAHLQKN